MSEGVFNPNLIVPAGTEIVARIPVRGQLLHELEEAGASSPLPELPSTGTALHELAVRVRLQVVRV